MRKAVSFLLITMLIVSMASIAAYGDPGNGNSKNKGFRDIQGNWGAASILKMQEMGFFYGYEDGTFRPDQTLTQDEIAVLLDRIREQRFDEDGDWDLEDEDLKVVPGWAKKSVAKGLQNQYINLNRYHSQVQCDRLLAVVQLAKALGVDPVDPDDIDDNPFQFRDRNLISDEDYGYLLAMFNKGYLKGYPDGKFNPNALMSRVQMAALIDRILEDTDGDPTDKQPPIWPTGSAITASAITTSSITLTWSAATDNVGVTLYRITYKDGTDKVKYISQGRTTTITGLTADREFTFTVYARDGAGNWSNPGPWVKATTLKAAEPVETALKAVNDADTRDEMHSALTTYASVLGLDMTKYNALLDKTSVLDEMLEHTFTDKVVLKAIFDDAVEDAQ